jgi:hypothetical protein
MPSPLPIFLTAALALAQTPPPAPAKPAEPAMPTEAVPAPEPPPASEPGQPAPEEQTEPAPGEPAQPAPAPTPAEPAQPGPAPQVQPPPAPGQAQPAAPVQAPRITFETLNHDFGKIPGDAKVSYRFKVTNTGKAPLNITRVNPSCGCTSTVLGKWTLAPGESSEVEATFNPAGYRGAAHKSIQVVSDDPISPVTTLTFQADVVREIMPSTDSVFFQDVIRSAPRKASVKLVSGNDKPVQLIDAKAPGAPYLGATLRQDGKDAWVDILLDGHKIPPGKQLGADAILVRTTNPRVPTIPITVQWEMRASVVADPVRVAWVEPAGTELTAPVVLKQVDGRPFRILSFKSTSPAVTVRDLDKTAAPSHDFTVVLRGDARPGLYTERLQFTLDDPDQPEFDLRVSAALRETTTAAQ